MKTAKRIKQNVVKRIVLMAYHPLNFSAARANTSTNNGSNWVPLSAMMTATASSWVNAFF
jgi:hypothetical protein